MGNGWRVHFAEGTLTPLQFRALIYAGAGAVLQGIYGQLPVSERLQKDFVDAHAIYIDGFRPPQGGQPAAYYVIDPIGHPWAGYRGEWLPATDIEAFAAAFGGGRMVTSWAFPGGLTPPANYPTLPPEAFPSSSGPGASAAPSASGGASPSTEPSGSPVASAAPTPPPLPAPATAPPSDGGSVSIAIPPDILTLLQLQASGGGTLIVPAFALCLTQPIPASCPAGLPATYPSGASPGPAPSPTSPIDLLYASIPQPGQVQVIFSGPGSAASLAFWRADGTGPVQAADVQPAIMGGNPVWVATLPVVTGGYGFSASTQGSGIAGLSQVGSVKVGP